MMNIPFHFVGFQLRLFTLKTDKDPYPKEVWKLNFRQYGEMKMKQPGRNSDVEKVSREKIRDGESQMREDAGARNGRRAKHCVFPVFCGSGGSKGRLAKAAGAEVAGQRRHEKLHAVVARSTFSSQKCQNTSVSDHFWKLRCGKSARRCGAKHISK